MKKPYHKPTSSPPKPRIPKSETRGNRETESQRDGVSEIQRNTDTEKQTIKTTRKIPLLASHVATLSQAVELSLDGGLHSNSIFIFCRAIKAFEITTGVRLPPKELENAFALWWSIARPELPSEADFDEFRFDFWLVFEKTKMPLGANPLRNAIELADSSPPPPEALRYESAKIKRLVGVCFQLQVLSGDAPFFLGSRDAATILNASKPQIGLSTLAGLVKDGVLEVAWKGEPGGAKATRYRYLSVQSAIDAP